MILDALLIFGGLWFLLSVAAGISIGRAIRRGETTLREAFGVREGR